MLYNIYYFLILLIHIIIIIFISNINCYSNSNNNNNKYQKYKTKYNSIANSEINPISNEKNINTFGIKLDARKLTKEEFSKYDGKLPVIIKNAFQIDHDWITAEFINRFKDNTIEYDVRQSSNGTITSYEANFMEFIATIPDNSDHEDNMYLMNEDLLRNEEDLNEQFKLDEDLFEHDLFNYFPDKIKPHIALIIGGVGARSFLHVDPYEWTGWNYLLEGKKLWTFLPPDHCDSEKSLLNPRRTAPEAWGKHKIAAGWISDVDLYKYQIAESMLDLLPDIKKKIKIDGLSTLSMFWGKEILKGDTKKKNTNANIPVFSSGIKEIDECLEPSLLTKDAYQIVQEEGDLILIPPKYWHQVYHLQPSIAIASQYINSNVKNQVYAHILKWCHENPAENRELSPVMISTLPNDFQNLDDKQQVCAIIKAGLIERHGVEKGKKIFNILMTENE